MATEHDVSRRAARGCRLAGLLVGAMLLVAVGSCSDARLEPVTEPPEPELDNRLRIKGEFCTEPSADVTFPVKVLYIVDQSASLQCTDSNNRRFQALNSSIDSLQNQPNAQFGFIGFSSWSRTTDFTRDRGVISQFTDPNQGGGPATDYQGALATAVRIIEQDIENSPVAERARTRYIVNFVSDGIPEPRCNAGCEDTVSDCSDGDDNDGDGLVDGSDPDCANINDNSLHPDNLYGVCNTDMEIPDDVYVDIDGVCPEYNQPTQIIRRVQELIELKDAYSVGDMTLNTILLFSPQSVVEGVCPGAGQQFGYVRTEAESLLQSMANEGDGIYRDVDVTEVDDDFLTFEVTSITASNTLTSLSAHSEYAIPGDEDPLADTDADGLSNDYEVEIQTDRQDADTDDDFYGDFFEHRLESEGFDPLDAMAPAVSCGGERDGDGDRLNDCEEEFLGTSPILPDTDGDGILDFQEFLAGTDPLEPDARADHDFDGILNGAEIKGGSDPLEPDAQSFREKRVVYDIDDRGLEDVDPDPNSEEERHCYDFDVRNIQMAVTPIPQNRGLNRVLIYTSEQAARVAGVPGEVRVACFEGFYNGGLYKEPPSGLIDVSPEHLDELRTQLSDQITQLEECPYFSGGFNRSAIEQMMDACMPPKIQVRRKLYPQPDLFDMLRRNFDGNNQPKLPQRSYELFVPIQNFDPANDCHRPWEFDLLGDVFDQALDACNTCAGGGG